MNTSVSIQILNEYFDHTETRDIMHEEREREITLMTGTLGLNLEESWFRTSARSCWCFKTFRIFMILTMAAWVGRDKDQYSGYKGPCGQQKEWLQNYTHNQSIIDG